jgi:hypothetical protein
MGSVGVWEVWERGCAGARKEWKRASVGARECGSACSKTSCITSDLRWYAYNVCFFVKCLNFWVSSPGTSISASTSFSFSAHFTSSTTASTGPSSQIGHGCNTEDIVYCNPFSLSAFLNLPKSRGLISCWRGAKGNASASCAVPLLLLLPPPSPSRLAGGRPLPPAPVRGSRQPGQLEVCQPASSRGRAPAHWQLLPPHAGWLGTL